MDTEQSMKQNLEFSQELRCRGGGGRKTESQNPGRTELLVAYKLYLIYQIPIFMLVTKYPFMCPLM